MSKKYLDLDGLEEVVEQIKAKYAQIADIPTTPAEVGALPATTKYGASVTASVNTSTYVCTFQLKDQDGNNLGSATTIDLPIESAIVNASYDNTTKDLTFTLQNGNTVTVPMGDIISGLQAEITSSNKLSADLVNDASTTNSFIKEITSATNIWELADGIYKGSAGNFKYKSNTSIGEATGTSIVFVYTSIDGSTKNYTAIMGESLAYSKIKGGIAGSSNGTISTKTLASLLEYTSVVNNLTSTSTIAPLSANMGKTLKDAMDNMPDTAITTAEIEALFV